MKLHLLLVLRRLIKNKSNLVINISGLLIGSIVFVYIIGWMISEKSYDKFWENNEDIYRVELKRTADGEEVQNTAMNYYGAGPVLKNDLPGIEASTNLIKDIISVFTPRAFVPDIDMFFTDSSFFKVFNFPVRCENKGLLFSDIHYAIISRSLGLKLFGNTNPVNQTFKLNEGWEFMVMGVFDDIPENSHLHFDLILQRKALFYYMRNFNPATGELDNSNISGFSLGDPYARGQWGRTQSYTYIRLKQGSNIGIVQSQYSRAIEPCIAHIRERNENVDFEFNPVTRIHLHSDKSDEIKVNGSQVKLWGFLIIAILLLFTSLLNYNNTSIASSISIMKSRDINRILGAKRKDILFEYLSEALVIHGSVGIICFILTVIFLGNGSEFMGFKVYPLQLPQILAINGLLMLFGILSSAFYPFLFTLFSKGIQKNSTVKIPGSANRQMQTLVIMQFAAAIFLIIGAITIYRQVNFMVNRDTGMQIEHTLVSYSPMTMNGKPNEASKLEAFRGEVQKFPGVTGFTTAEIAVGSNYHRFNNRVALQNQDILNKTFALANVDYNFFEYFNPGFVIGKTFSFESSDEQVIINESACKDLGILPEKALNKIILINNRKLEIIGIVKDFHQESLHKKIQPAIYFNSRQWFRSVGHYFIKINTKNITETIKQVKSLWKEIYPEEEYYYTFLDERFKKNYLSDIQFGKVYLTLSILTIFIACLGLYALASFTLKSRVKEIGVRKVNGARNLDVSFLLNKEYIKWVTMSNIISSPIAYMVIKKWLENFAYNIQIGFWMFAFSGFVSLLIALITVSWLSWQAAIRNPVEALRYE